MLGEATVRPSPFWSLVHFCNSFARHVYSYYIAVILLFSASFIFRRWDLLDIMKIQKNTFALITSDINGAQYTKYDYPTSGLSHLWIRDNIYSPVRDWFRPRARVFPVAFGNSPPSVLRGRALPNTTFVVFWLAEKSPSVWKSLKLMINEGSC